MTSRTVISSVFAGLLLAACSSTPHEAASPNEPPGATSAPSFAPAPVEAPSTTAAAPSTPPAPEAQPSPPLDPGAVADATGGKPETSEGTVKVSFPRTDVPVEVDGWKMPPFMGLTSWAAFSPGNAGVQAMVMGDLVLFEDEVNPVMSTLLDAGVQVTALHNHFFYDRPRVYFMHIGGEGEVATLGKGVKLAMEKVTEIRRKTPKPAERTPTRIPARNQIDAARLENVLGVKGMAKDGMFKAVMGRETVASCGCKVGKAAGVNTWSAFAGTDEDAVVDGDFAVTENELQPVLKALRSGGIEIVAIHQHMTGETPRILFLHYWGRGEATALAATVGRALDLTAWEGKRR